MTRILTLIGLLFLMTATTAAHAGKFYKWTDDSGVTHYTAKPPEDRTAETIKLKSVKPATAEKNKPDTADENAAAVNQAPEIPIGQVQAPQPARVSQQEAQNCAIARRNLETLKIRTQIRVKDELTGEYRYSSTDEQSAAKTDAAEKIKRYCK
jgi:hypothetical protein